jgi:hypothetical protein
MLSSLFRNAVEIVRVLTECMKVLELDTFRAPHCITKVKEHTVEPDAGYCLVCRRGIKRSGLVEWSHLAG